MMEALVAFSNFQGEVPSPSGSDDSGIGLSPHSPTIQELRKGNNNGTFVAAALESPPESHFVTKSFCAGEYTEGRPPFSAWPYNQPGLAYDASSYLRDQLVDSKPTAFNLHKVDSDCQFQEIDSFLESIEPTVNNSTNPTATVRSLQLPGVDKTLPGAKNRKRANPSQRRLRGVDLNSKQILKLERCLQPKTGNGKPRQTSAKRKMSQAKRSEGNRPVVYPGVRPKTVREVLQQLRQSAKAANRPSGHASMSQQQQPRAATFRPQNPLINQSTNNFAVSPGNQQPIAPEYLERLAVDPFQPVASPPMGHNIGYPSPTSNYSSTPPPSNLPDCAYPQSLVGRPYASPLGEMSMQHSPNVMAFDQIPNCGAQMGSDPGFIQTMSPAASSVSCNSPYQTPSNPAFSPQPAYPPPEFTDLQSFVTSQNFASAAASFPPSYSCLDNSQAFDTNVTFMSSSSYAPVSGHDSSLADMLGAVVRAVIYDSVQNLVANLRQMQSAVDLQHLLNLKDAKGMTPLLYAVKTSSVEKASVLLRWGADTHAQDAEGQNILHLAAELEASDMMNFLAEKAPQQFADLCNGTAALKAGRTPLHIATEKGRIDSMVTLMRQGASLTAKEQRGGWSALHMAVKNSDLVATREILSFAAYGCATRDSCKRLRQRDTDAARKVVGQCAHNENTALHFAAELQVANNVQLAEAQSAIINLLLDNDADPSAKNHQNQFPFQLLSTTNAQICERLRVGRRYMHPTVCSSSNNSNNSGGNGSGKLNLNLPPLHPAVGQQQQQQQMRFNAASGLARINYLE